jgi:hypothetical protein
MDILGLSTVENIGCFEHGNRPSGKQAPKGRYIPAQYEVLGYEDREETKS